MALQENPFHIDPALVSELVGISLDRNTFETLVDYDANNKIVPVLAKSWETSADGKTYTFHLDPKAIFSNGDPVTSDDVKFSIQRALSPKIHSSIALSYLGLIQGAAAFNGGQAQDVSGISTPDTRTVVFHLNAPAPYFLGDLTYPTAMVLDAKVAPADSEIKTPKDFVGSGPFLMTSFSEDQSIVFRKNDKYWKTPVQLMGLNYVIAKDPQARLNLYKGNQIDLLSLDGADVGEIQRNPDLKKDLVSEPEAVTYYLGMNPKIYGPFADVRVRQAFAMAIDEKSIASETLQGNVDPATCILSPGVAGYRATGAPILPFDPAKANDLLSAAGHAKGAGLPPLSISYITGNRILRLVAEQVQADLQQNLGVKVSLAEMDAVSFGQQHQNQKLASFLYDWTADYLDPQDYLSLLFTTKGGSNFLGFSDPVVDSMVAKADTITNADQRIAYYQQIEDRILQLAPWKPLLFGRQFTLIRPEVKGAKANAFGFVHFGDVSIANN